MFDRMSGSDERMNPLLSFGFAALWRRRLVDLLGATPGNTEVDLADRRTHRFGCATSFSGQLPFR